MFRPAVPPPQGAKLLDATRQLPTRADLQLMDARQRADWLVTLQQILAAVTACQLETTAVFDANGDGETLHCARSTTSWLKGALGISGGEASRRVRLARTARDHLSTTVGLLRDGVITTEHLQVIAKAVADLPDQQVGPAVDVLNELATQAGVDDLAAAGRHLNQVINPDGSLAQCEKDYTRRRLFLSPMLDGMVALDGILDAEAGATLTTALQPFLVPTDPTDDRDTAQRRADGLVELAHLAMTQGQLPVTGGSKPQLSVLTTLEALTELRGAMSSRVESTGAVIGSVATRRIACDATVTRVLLDPEGVPVGLGRSQRLFTPQQRQLLALRDGGCRFPDCGMPPAFTDAHHLTPWAQGGPTDLQNALLVCRFHHRRLHEGQWTVQPHDDIPGANAPLTLTGPTGQQLRSTPKQFSVEQLAKLTWWAEPPDPVARNYF